MIISEKIRELRKDREWTQQRLADEIGVHKNMIVNWEKGHCYPNALNCLSMADVFGVSLDELCCRKARYGKQI